MLDRPSAHLGGRPRGTRRKIGRESSIEEHGFHRIPHAIYLGHQPTRRHSGAASRAPSLTCRPDNDPPGPARPLQLPMFQRYAHIDRRWNGIAIAEVGELCPVLPKVCGG